ncbi:MAG: hypothetical protein EOP45_10065 [Sphingobacteriaceae bacterium]|nr:MAG: hypothetical protein EOP45_10065 [Sphingobacteriaceae bacterium]
MGLIGEIRSRYQQCRIDFENLLDLDPEEVEEDDPDDDFWEKLAEKKAKRKIVFSNKKKSV